jgi:hypothetical protein
MVSPAEWGPNAWELLHGIAERIGNHSNKTLIRDEQNELRLTLRHFGALLPCPKCQEHYRDSIRKSFPNTTLYGEYLKDAVRKWLFNLHEAVNSSKELNPGITLDMLPERYKSIDLRAAATRLRSVYQRGVQVGALKPDEWKLAWKHLDYLLRFIGV